jgi:LPXTG-site transpeptidase (sortase) family protein
MEAEVRRHPLSVALPGPQIMAPIVAFLAGAAAVVVVFIAAGEGPFDSSEGPSAGIVVTETAQEPASPQQVEATEPAALAPFTLPDLQLLAGQPPRPPIGGETGMNIVIPKLDVNQPAITMSVYSDGRTFQVPGSAHEVAWYDFSGAPGSASQNAIFAGHINYYGAQGTFRWISNLATGDVVEIHQIDGTVHVYNVIWTRQIYKPSLSWEDVGCQPGVGCSSQNTITLITCGGAFDRSSGHYVDNTVVRAELVETRKAV